MYGGSSPPADRRRSLRRSLFVNDRRAARVPSPLDASFPTADSTWLREQARGTFRSAVEIVDLMIMVLASDATCREYIKSFEDPKASYRHWRNHLSPSVIRTSISKLEADNPITIPIDMTPTQIRQDTYSWLSNFIHVDFVAHVVTAHPANLTARWETAMLGSVGEMSKATLAHSLVYLWISLLRLENLLWEKHSWGRLRGSRSRSGSATAVVPWMNFSYPTCRPSGK